jgi:hypothetical protein
VVGFVVRLSLLPVTAATLPADALLPEWFVCRVDLVLSEKRRIWDTTFFSCVLSRFEPDEGLTQRSPIMTCDDPFSASRTDAVIAGGDRGRCRYVVVVPPQVEHVYSLRVERFRLMQTKGLQPLSPSHEGHAFLFFVLRHSETMEKTK